MDLESKIEEIYEKHKAGLSDDIYFIKYGYHRGKQPTPKPREKGILDFTTEAECEEFIQRIRLEISSGRNSALVVCGCLMMINIAETKLNNIRMKKLMSHLGEHPHDPNPD